jgi:hypothetical protein
LDLSLTGKGKSKLATSITDLGKVKSVVAGLVGGDSALSLVHHFALPDELRKALAPVIDEAIKKGLEEEKDKTKREVAARLARVIEPTLKAGELDLAVDMRGPSAGKLYTLVAGLKLQDGEAIEKALRDTIKDLPPEERAKIKLDADQAGKVRIHRLDVQKDYNDDFRKAFGDNPAYVAFRADAMFVAVGDKGVSALKEALAAPAKPGVPLRLEVSLARLAPAINNTPKDAVKAAEEAFKQKDSDRVRVTLEGGDSLRLRASMKAAVIKFLAIMADAGNAGGQ